MPIFYTPPPRQPSARYVIQEALAPSFVPAQRPIYLQWQAPPGPFPYDIYHRSLLAAIASAQRITVNSPSTSTYQTAQASYTWQHACAGENRYLTVGIAMLSVAGSSVSTITYDGVTLSLLGSRASVSGAIRVELWGLLAPHTGTHTISVTLSAALDSIGSAVSFAGVQQETPTESFASASATNVGAADATVDVVTVANHDWTVDIVATDDTAITVGAGQIVEENITGTLGSGAMSVEADKTPAGTVTMSWTNVGALATWSIASIALRPVDAPLILFPFVTIPIDLLFLPLVSRIPLVTQSQPQDGWITANSGAPTFDPVTVVAPRQQTTMLSWILGVPHTQPMPGDTQDGWIRVGGSLQQNVAPDLQLRSGLPTRNVLLDMLRLAGISLDWLPTSTPLPPYAPSLAEMQLLRSGAGPQLDVRFLKAWQDVFTATLPVNPWFVHMYPGTEQMYHADLPVLPARPLPLLHLAIPHDTSWALQAILPGLQRQWAAIAGQLQQLPAVVNAALKVVYLQTWQDVFTAILPASPWFLYMYPGTEQMYHADMPTLPQKKLFLPQLTTLHDASWILQAILPTLQRQWAAIAGQPYQPPPVVNRTLDVRWITAPVQSWISTASPLPPYAAMLAQMTLPQPGSHQLLKVLYLRTWQDIFTATLPVPIFSGASTFFPVL